MKADYTDISKTYDRYRSYPKSLIEKIAEFGGISQGMKILDLGCGTGNVAFQLRELTKVSVIGVDISLPMLKVARGKSLDVIRSDVDSYQLPFHDSSSNAVIVAYVIHQISNLDSFFSECYRVLRSGALVLLTSSHKQIEFDHPVFTQFFPSCIDIDKARFPDIPEIDNSLQSAGFRDIKHHEVVGENIPIDQQYLRKVKGKYVSTYRLLPQREFELGVKRLEAFIESRSGPEFTESRATLIYGRKL